MEECNVANASSTSFGVKKQLEGRSNGSLQEAEESELNGGRKTVEK